MSNKTTVGLRVDADTLRGTMLGVPSLIRALKKRETRATFFFSVGPDNMGRNIFRLLRPAFAWKMLRSKAPNLYGWDILLKGTLGPGPIIGKKAADAIRQAARTGHEIGLHAWDHFKWQNYLHKIPEPIFRKQFQRAFELLSEIIGAEPVASANPAWRSSPMTLRIKEEYLFDYNSDCRGSEIFIPVIQCEDGGDGKEMTPQVPVTLPTFDELIGTKAVIMENYNDSILSHIKSDQLNVLTIHAEAEGIACADLFEDFLNKCVERNIELVPLGEIFQDRRRLTSADIPRRRIEERTIPGREGKVAMPVLLI